MRPKRSTPEMEHRAGELRKEMTPAERRLWAYLRNRQLGGIKFRRQHAVGPFVADFYAPQYKLIVELDGSQHLDQSEYDVARTAYLNEQGYRVIRFWNNEIMDQISEVLRVIEQACCTSPSCPSDIPEGQGGAKPQFCESVLPSNMIRGIHGL